MACRLRRATRGEVIGALRHHEVLDNNTLQWLTNSATSAGRLYWENRGRSAIQSAAWGPVVIGVHAPEFEFEKNVETFAGPVA